MTKKEVIKNFGYPYTGKLIMNTLYQDHDEIPDDVIEALYKEPEPRPFIMLTGPVGMELINKTLDDERESR